MIAFSTWQLSFRHLPSWGSWIISDLASGDQVLGQMIYLVPAGMEAGSLCFVSSILMIDGLVGESPLHWPNRVIPSHQRTILTNKSGWHSRVTKRWGKKRCHWKYRGQLITWDLPYKKNDQCMLVLSALLLLSIRISTSVISFLHSSTLPHFNLMLFTFLYMGNI